VRARRRPSAILVAGYSRLFPGDEKEDFAELRAFGSKLIEPLILEFGGNTFKETAELVLAETLLHGSIVRRRGLEGISGSRFLTLGRHRAIQSEPRSPSSHPEAAAQSDELGCL